MRENMKKTEKFKIIGGEFEMKSQQETKNFVQGSAEYVADFILQFQKSLGLSGSITTVCKESDRAFSLKMNGSATDVSGVYAEGKNVRLNELLAD